MRHIALWFLCLGCDEHFLPDKAVAGGTNRVASCCGTGQRLPGPQHSSFQRRCVLFHQPIRWMPRDGERGYLPFGKMYNPFNIDQAVHVHICDQFWVNDQGRQRPLEMAPSFPSPFILQAESFQFSLVNSCHALWQMEVETETETYSLIGITNHIFWI